MLTMKRAKTPPAINLIKNGNWTVRFSSRVRITLLKNTDPSASNLPFANSVMSTV